MAKPGHKTQPAPSHEAAPAVPQAMAQGLELHVGGDFVQAAQEAAEAALRGGHHAEEYVHTKVLYNLVNLRKAVQEASAVTKSAYLGYLGRL